VILVGSFLGIGGRLIIVNDSLKLVGNKVVLANGTKDGLKVLLEFNYAVQYAARLVSNFAQTGRATGC
jgi:hypothetical protein